MTFIKNVLHAISQAEQDGLLDDGASHVLDGLSGAKSVGLLQRLVQLSESEKDSCYLEIGVFQGLTLLSVANAFPDVECFGIDNFSILDPESKNLNIVEERTEKLNAKNATLINLDFEKALQSLDQHIGSKKVSVFLVDGAHDYRSQLMCLLLGRRHLSTQSVILIDDANYKFVRQSTADFLLSHPEYKMVFEAYSPMHPANMTANMLAEWEQGWLNGVNILVHDPDDELPVMMPPVDDDRTLYVNEWLVHRHQFAELAPEAVDLAQAICLDNTASETMAREKILNRYQQYKSTMANRYPDRNVYSDDLIATRYNEPKKI